MYSYLKNNYILIEKYKGLYKNGINIDDIIEKFRKGELLKASVYDYSRFRVFIDSCMLLFNREKIIAFLKEKYSFKEYFENLELDENLKICFEIAKEANKISDAACELFYSFDDKIYKPWDQVAIIRNAMAHMQYGLFTHMENGYLVSYAIYNKDKGDCKKKGIVVEPVLDDFIGRFFSNYSYGIPYKHTFISDYSFIENNKIDKLIFYEITTKDNYCNIYNGYNDYSTKRLSEEFKGDVITYLKNNFNLFDIQEKPLYSFFDKNACYAFATKRGLSEKEDYYYGLKTILDPETEISNFLVHIKQLNDVLYEYELLKNNLPDIDNYNKNISRLIDRLNELKEDENAKIAFEIGFTYLKMMNFILRFEDDDINRLNYDFLDVSNFEFSCDNVKKYCESNKITKYKEQMYIVERMRNSVMHGNISFKIDLSGNIAVVLIDKYNNRAEKIEVKLEDLEDFLLNSKLYEDILEETPIYIIKKI